MRLETPQQSARRSFEIFRGVALFVVAMSLPGLALATGTDAFQTDTCAFLTRITTLLNIASVAVVTIAIIFAGYQIAFAHKRISDVAPILIGGLLIGAAGQLATWIMSNRDAGASCGAI